ncbi:RAC-gamma serine/threonine-protein kinase-like [Oscarella lobularis]|uniref:RAC-gamma serine/threonine-protein kinase-like n=1 Tax=Oscarella lobularis TaxID=121494 RepID=UPI0033141BA5
MASVLVKEGWLSKRGEYIKNWRPRYFQLWSDGSLYGYKEPPKDGKTERLNNFSVEKCQLMKMNKGKKSGFVMRVLQWTNFIERFFSVDRTDERDAWVEAIEKVSAALEANKEKSSSLEKSSSKAALEDFEMLKVLGRGTFGKVCVAREKTTGELFAVKILKKDVIIAKEEVAHTLTENQVLKTTKHPFLTSLRFSFQTEKRLYLVMEYAQGGELFFHLSKERMFSEERSRFYACEIILAIKYLHENSIVYRDLKLENILLDRAGHIKLADFGLCKQDVTMDKKTTTFCGTPEYLAPEVLEEEEYGRSVDWWGVGVVMYEMICGRLPFYNRDHEVLFELILTQDVKFPDRCGERARSILSGLLEKDPTKRLGGSQRDAEEIMEHVFFSEVNWDDVYDKKVPVLFVPEVKADVNDQVIPQEFKDDTVDDTPPDQEASALNEKEDGQFEGFSYAPDSGLGSK